jgi:quercetin dioxygenase-like cupin family protein
VVAVTRHARAGESVKPESLPAALPSPRRIVTGLDAQGRSCILIDGPVPKHSISSDLIWRSSTVPADNSGSQDMAVPFVMDHLHDGGSNFILVTFPPHMGPSMHATDTLDYLVVLSGQIVMQLEAEEVVLHPGDLIVDRGVIHAWRNDTDQPATMVSVTLPAMPVGNGRTA